MLVSLDHTHGSSRKKTRITDQIKGGGSLARWRRPAFWGAVVVLLIMAVLMRLYHLDLPFDRDSYDEGVYWQSLRAMQSGQQLYSQIFYSQPPLFLLSTFPGYVLFGSSLWSARLGIALVSLPGFPGIFLLGWALAGRRGALVGLLLLLIDPLYLMQSQIIQAEASSVAFTLLAVAFAWLWWKQPDGWRGLCWASLCALTFALSVLCKLLCVATIVPIGLLMLTRAWQIARKKPGTSAWSWLPLAASCVVALLVLLAGVAPFLGSFHSFWSGVWSFHIAAAKASAMSLTFNVVRVLTGFLSVTALAGLFGGVVALLRRDWRVLPIWAWLIVTMAVLLKQQPLFIHHLVALTPPLITLAILGLARPEEYLARLSKFPEKNEYRARLIPRIVMCLIIASVLGGAIQDGVYYHGANEQAAGPITGQMLQVANDLRHVTKPGDLVLTDGQFVAALADRSTLPWLVDTSTVRMQTGYITVAGLEQAAMNPRVRAILFYTNRFYAVPQVAGFHTWVIQHFRFYRSYISIGQELWIK